MRICPYSIETRYNATVNALNVGSSVQDVLNYTLNDNHGTDPKSAIGTLTVTINGTNDAPIIADIDGDVLIHIDGGGAQVLNQGVAASVSDIDSLDFDTGSLRVEITHNALLSEDVISIQDQGTGAGQIGVAGPNVKYENKTIGIIDGSSTNILLTINFDSDADVTSVSALLNAITYENTNLVSPSTLDRTVDFTIADGDGGTSTVASVLVTDLDIDAGIGIEVDDTDTIHPEDVIELNEGEIDFFTLVETNNAKTEATGGALGDVLTFLGPEIIDLLGVGTILPEF